MKVPRKPRDRQPPSLVIYGDSQHNTAFYISIGQLVMHWANNESVFLAILQLMLGSRDQGEVIWFSQTSTKARTELVARLAKATISDEKIVSDIEKLRAAFDKLSAARNFYCHAMYELDGEQLSTATAVHFDKTNRVFKYDTRSFDASRLNEMSQASAALHKLNAELWAVVLALEKLLGRRIRLPSQKLPHPNTE
jgi:hypothetical protein